MIRPALLSDIPAIRALMESEPGFWQPNWSEKTIATAIVSANGLAFVWEEDFRILGFVCAHDLGFRGYLSELIVSWEARNQGVGDALVRRVEEGLDQRQQATVIADVWRDAVPFYESLGWERPEAVLLRQKLPYTGNTRR